MTTIQQVIEYLQQDAPWVNFDQTRDCVLFGNDNQEVKKIGVCWVATNKVIEEAITLGINFIISHENPFYEASTKTYSAIRQATHNKQELLKQHDICIYRCHDVWDNIKDIGVSDTYAKLLGYDFEPRDIHSYIQFSTIEPTTLQQVALHFKTKLSTYGQSSIQYIGEVDQIIQSLAIGTGAATNIFEMTKYQPDCFVVSDDGHNNWIETQWILDHHKAMIIVHHPTCEIPGLMNMVSYLSKPFNDIDISYIEEGFHFHSV